MDCNFSRVRFFSMLVVICTMLRRVSVSLVKPMTLSIHPELGAFTRSVMMTTIATCSSTICWNRMPGWHASPLSPGPNNPATWLTVESLNTEMASTRPTAPRNPPHVRTSASFHVYPYSFLRNKGITPNARSAR